MTTPTLFSTDLTVRDHIPAKTALESNFPAAALSVIAEQESWRKEVHRPATHTHKWWAQRLGSVFRGILVAAVTPEGEDAMVAYSQPLRLDGLVVADVFAGSGTTVAEAAKLGARVVARDINPVAALVTRQSLNAWDQGALIAAYKTVESSVREEIDSFHRTVTGEPVLYYFWVARTACPQCPTSAPPVELFSSYVFSQHAYPKKHPIARATCPDCHEVNFIDLSKDSTINCTQCKTVSPLSGPVNRQSMTCRAGHVSKVKDALDENPPEMFMYAKQVLCADGRTRRYDAIDDFDLELYAASEDRLGKIENQLIQPTGWLATGYNTNQAMGWGYRQWRQFFNSRQLLSLGLLASAIADLPESPEREALATLFSGVLEFNNLFCSFKGEGTGAVRHMFNHHILKPERTPLEAHPWGTPASSGSFSTLFKSRLLRALEYKANPADLVVRSNGKVERTTGLAQPMRAHIGSASELFSRTTDAAYISVGSSASFDDLPDQSVDLVITDPPYMDNVHYSELADFFHAWLRHLKPWPAYPDLETTRHPDEVQSPDPVAFGQAIAAVWTESARILKADGLIAFTFHQARVSGWLELVNALETAGLVVTAVQPVKGEMSTSSTKSGAADPSNLDSIVVCRKRAFVVSDELPTVNDVVQRAQSALAVLLDANLTVGYTDVLSVVRGSVLTLHTLGHSDLGELSDQAEEAVVKVAKALGINSARQTK